MTKVGRSGRPTADQAMDPAFRGLFDAQARAVASQPRPAPGALPLPVVRAGYRAQRQAQDRSPPQDMEVRALRVRGGSGELDGRLYVPAGAATPSPLLVYFHGGGFVLGDLDTHDGHCRRLAAGAPCRVLAVDYRLAPEHPFPAAHDDAVNATRWSFDHADEIGADRRRIAVGGDSAGGNLAASTAIALARDPQRRLVFQLLLYPVTWPSEPTASRRTLDGPVLTPAGLAWFESCLAFRGHRQARRAQLERADPRDTPCALIVTAGFDPLKDEGRDYARRLAAEGVDVEHIEFGDLPHDFYVMADVSPGVGRAVALTVGLLGGGLA